MPIKVLWVIDSLWVGGTERSLAELLAPLSRAGVTSVVACLRRRGTDGVEEDVLRAGHAVHFLPESGRVARLRALRALIRAERPDVVHTALYRATIAARLANAGLPPPLLTSLVNAPYGPEREVAEGRKPTWRARAARELDRWSGRFLTDHFHAVSASAAAAAARDLGIAPTKVTVVERGRDGDRLGRASAARRQRARDELRLDDDAEVVLTVGRQDSQKGHRFLLQAIADLARARPRLVLLVAGREGQETAQLQALCRQLDLGERVRWLGHRADVPELLAAADVLAFPSLYEGMPGAILEAMALELPVVASRIPAVAEIVEDGASGILVAPTSAGELAAAIARLLDDRALGARLAVRGRRLFEQRFDLERSAERLADLYRALVGRPARPQRSG